MKFPMPQFAEPNEKPWCSVPHRCAILLVSIVCLASVSVGYAESDEDFFEARVRPLLIKHCLECHGAKKQEGGLRLDSRDGWLRGGDRGTAVIAGQPENSLLLKAVRHDDPDLAMPPNEKLTANEISALELWIKRGAPDPRRAAAPQTASRLSLQESGSFWSFRPLQKPPIPSIAPDDWVRNPIDAFVLNRLKERGLTPVADADRRTLLRRATLDLTGLPPTLDELNAFLNDPSEDAFDSVIDRLLESPAYGERWGRHWLDVARYADTAGDGADYPVREAVKYRDWVIDALNADKPFDAFVAEQIAGDILAQQRPAEEYASCVTATGFLAIGKRYGYKASPDYQYLDFADVIDSLGRSLLGLSVGCARCHDHKYDPVSMADYYALYGILESTTWAFPGGEEQKRPAHFPPLVPADEVVRLEEQKTQRVARLDREIAALNRQRLEQDPNWLAGGVDLGFESQVLDKPPGKPWVTSGPISVTDEAQSPFQHVHPQGKLGVRIGSGQPNDGLRYVFEQGLRAAPGKQMHFTIDFRSVASSRQTGAFRFYLGRGVVQSIALECSATATEFAIRNGSQWEKIQDLEPGTWYTLHLTIDPATKKYSGRLGTQGELTVFQDKQLAANWDGVIDCFICDAIGHVGGPACARDLDNLGLQEVAFGLPGTGPVKIRVADANEKEQLAKLDAKIKDLTSRRQAVAAEVAYPVAYGVTEGTPRNARVQQRGEPQRLGNEVPRRNLEVLGGHEVAQGTGSGRLALARWMTHPQNPLTARVFVNRVWQWHFGTGIVATPSDFGSRGAAPTHPQLLDWLAAEFIASGWSVKTLHRRIMSSRTYQLASVDSEAGHATDPTNRWHWRYSRRPLDAESIRDGMLALSGGLDQTVPQPHPFPSVNTWGFTIHNPFHAIYDSNHRSVYLMVQRNRRHPYLVLFDAADPNQSVAFRQATTTPTQALYLMNSPFVHEQAAAFARRITSQTGDARAKVRWAFETTQGRIPPTVVVDDAVAFVASYRERSAGKATVADQETQAWAALARVLFTSNAFLFVD